MSNPFTIGKVYLWWPGNTDYPSTVVLVKQVSDSTWLVNYATEPDKEDWEVPEIELS